MNFRTLKRICKWVFVILLIYIAGTLIAIIMNSTGTAMTPLAGVLGLAFILWIFGAFEHI